MKKQVHKSVSFSLTRSDERRYRIVELHFFGGLGVEKTANLKGISPRLVGMEWGMARAWLYLQLQCA